MNEGTKMSVRFEDFTTTKNYIANYQGVDVLHGPGLVTEKQAKYILSLANEREGVTDDMRNSLFTRLAQGFAKHAASQFIERYRGLPRKAYVAVQKAQVPTEDGIYVDPATERIFKLQFNRGQGDGTRLYAKQLTIGFTRGTGDYEEHSEGLLSLDLTGVEKAHRNLSWDYRSNMIREVKPEWRLTPEQAVSWGALYGNCVRCHRDLTKESSIRQNMGDWCAGKQGF